MRNGRRSTRHRGRIWFLKMIDGPHAGYALMAPTAVEGLVNPQPGQRVEVMHADTRERFVVEVVDVEERTARFIEANGPKNPL